MSALAIRSLVEMLHSPEKWDSKAKELWAGSDRSIHSRMKSESADFKAQLKQRAIDYREASQKAVHIFDISTEVLEKLFTASLTKAGLLGADTIISKRVKEKYPNIVRDLSEVFQENMIFAVKSLQGGGSKSAPMIVEIEENSGTVRIIIGTSTSNTNNFEAISALIKKAAGSSVGGHNEAYRKLISDYIGGIIDTVDADGNPIEDYIDLDLKKKSLALLEKANVGLDRGHYGDSSNIAAAVGAMVFNKVHTLPVFKAPIKDETRQKLLKDLTAVQESLSKYIDSPDFSNQLSSYVFNNPEVVKAVLSSTIGYLRRLAAGEVKAVVDETDRFNNSVLQDVARKVTAHIIPQDDSENRTFGGELERAIGAHLRGEKSKYSYNIGRILYAYMRDEIQLPGLPKFLDLGGSPSIKDMAINQFDTALRLGKIQTSVNFKGGASKQATGSAKINLPKAKSNTSVSQLPKVQVPAISKMQLRGKTGRFVSLVNIVNLINLQLADKIRQNMGSPRLNYRTGRFAQSAQVLPATVDKDGAIRLPYTYLKKPYQTFEVGYSKGTPSRDPRVVISESIRELAIKQVTAKLRIVRV